MSLLDKFSKSVSNVINDEVNKVTSNIENKLENAVNDLFHDALKGIGIGGKLGRALESEFGNAIQNAKADKFFGTVTSVSERATASDICNNLTPNKGAETAFEASERTKEAQKGSGASIYQFPLQSMAYYTKLEFRQYVRPSPQTIPTTKNQHTIILPLPKDLEESLAVRLNETDAGVAGAAFNILQSGVKNPSGTSADVKNAIMQYAVAKVNEAASGQVGQFLGAIPNPYVTLMFQGVGLRSFSFTWTFSPRNVEESRKVQQIIKLLKMSALPAYSPNNGAGFLQYPLMCKVTLCDSEGEWNKGPGGPGSHPIIGFKNALIENVTVNYAPNGIPSFFAGTKLPTFYQVGMQFKEVEYFTADDYGRTGDKDGVSELDKIWDDLKKDIPLLGTAAEEASKIVNAGAGALQKAAQSKVKP